MLPDLPYSGSIVHIFGKKFLELCIMNKPLAANNALSLPAANQVLGKVMFLHLSVSHSVHYTNLLVSRPKNCNKYSAAISSSRTERNLGLVKEC